MSDASDSWGCGAYSGNNWFQLKWIDPITLQSNIGGQCNLEISVEGNDS